MDAVFKVISKRWRIDRKPIQGGINDETHWEQKYKLRVRMGVESRRAKPVTAGLAHSDPRMPLAFDLLTVPHFRPEGVSHGPLGRDLQFQSVDRKMN